MLLSYFTCITLTVDHVVRAHQHAGDPAQLYYSRHVPALRGLRVRHQSMQDPTGQSLVALIIHLHNLLTLLLNRLHLNPRSTSSLAYYNLVCCLSPLSENELNLLFLLSTDVQCFILNIIMYPTTAFVLLGVCEKTKINRYSDLHCCILSTFCWPVLPIWVLGGRLYHRSMTVCSVVVIFMFSAR